MEALLRVVMGRFLMIKKQVQNCLDHHLIENETMFLSRDNMSLFRLFLAIISSKPDSPLSSGERAIIEVEVDQNL